MGTTTRITAVVIRGYPSLLLEVSNIRIAGAALEVQLRADREPDKPRWWQAPTTGSAPAEFKAVSEALEKKRPVFAELGVIGANLAINAISIQYAETGR